MTWGGYFYNVAAGITEILPTSKGTTGSNSNHVASDFDRNQDRENDINKSELITGSTDYREGLSDKNKSYISEQDKQIDEIAAAVDILGGYKQNLFSTSFQIRPKCYCIVTQKQSANMILPRLTSFSPLINLKCSC